MISIAGLFLLRTQQTFQPLDIRPAPNRYALESPFPSLPAILADVQNDGWGLSQQTAKNRGLQARVLWIDGTANLESMGSKESIARRFSQIAATGFNTIVYDVKPIVGYTIYPSRFTRKLTEWKGQKLDEFFDPLAVMCVEAKKNKLSFLVSLNTFSEGHRLTRTGPGYERPEEQTVQYEADPIVIGPWPDRREFRLNPTVNPEATRPDEIGVLTMRPESPDSATIYVAVSVSGIVTQVSKQFPKLAEGGAILTARDGESGGDFLVKEARVGTQLNFSTKARFVLAQDAQTQWPLMMNPHLRSVQLRAMSFAQEIAARYDVNGILFDDRLRFGALNADFSEEARRQFESYTKSKLKWPEDVYTVTVSPRLVKGILPGKFYDTWLTWRALTMRNWIAETRASLRKINPGVLFGVYAGSWFGEYDKFGSNYSSGEFSAGFPYHTESYRKTGYAKELDIFIAGCYYKSATIASALETGGPAGRTVEAAGQLANRAARDQCWTYAGILLSDFAKNSRGLERALQAAAATTQGVMIFDYSHNIDEHWPTFSKAFAQPKSAPHQIRGLIAEIRKRREAVDKISGRRETVPIYEGAPGAGH